MDSNVSKNTYSHKFFKLRFTEEKLNISVKSLLKQYLLQTLNLYRQNLNRQLDLEYVSRLLEGKIFLSRSDPSKISSENKSNQLLSKQHLTSIIYSCPIALSLAQHIQVSPQIIAENIVNLLTLNRDNKITQSCLKFRVEVVTPGWVNFYFDSISLASWLEQSLIFLATKVPLYRNQTPASILNNQLQKTKNLFPGQYAHARCCSLLRLGARENLITLQDDDFAYLGWHLAQPTSISWLDGSENLWLTQEAEYELLRLLFVVTDFYCSTDTSKDKSVNWVKLALNLSQASEIFQAKCRILGEVKLNTPQKAIARLGLVALTQSWLQIILREKLEVTAPTTL